MSLLQYTVIGLVVLMLRMAAFLKTRASSLPERNELL
jgi:hypothetical protein